MSKTKISIIILLFASFIANAQLKIYSGGKVYVGGTTTTPNSLLSVGGAGNANYTIYGYNGNVGGGSALRVEMISPTGSSVSLASVGIVPSGQGFTYGIYGSSSKSTASNNGRAYGVYGIASNSTTGYNYGVYGILNGSNNGTGIFGSDGINGVDPVIGAKCAGFFDGLLVTTNGSPQKPGGGSWSTYSDARLKTSITPFKDALSIIRQINPIKYKYNGIGNLPTASFYYGVKAQDLLTVAPYCVGTCKMVVKQSDAGNFTPLQNLPADSSGIPKCIVNTFSVNYDALIYVLINSVKQLDSTLTSLKTQQNPTSSQRTSNVPTDTTIHITLSNNDIILYQNEPNPFDGSTIIRYFIPDNIKGNIYLCFYDIYGKEIRKLQLIEKGVGKIDAETENLAVGVYSYSIIVNDNVIDTKKMMKSK